MDFQKVEPGKGDFQNMVSYRKKPVVIQAALLDEPTLTAEHPSPLHIPGVIYSPENRCAYIETLEGRMTASLGDYIIRGVNGELYPCKPDVFAKTYELA